MLLGVNPLPCTAAVTLRNVLGMDSEPEIREAMQELLKPLSPSWVASQVGVTRQQVDRWKNGYNVTAERLDQVVDAVRDLLPAPQTQRNAPPVGTDGAARELLRLWRGKKPPPWADGLTQAVISAVRERREADEDALIEAALDRAVALGFYVRPTAEPSPDSEDRSPSTPEAEPGQTSKAAKPEDR